MRSPFRVTVDLLRDPLLRRLRQRGQSKAVALVPWFVALAMEAQAGGRIARGGKPITFSALAEDIPAPALTVSRAIVTLEAAGILARDGAWLRVVNWSKLARPFRSETKADIRERSRRCRERKRATMATRARTADATAA